MNDAMLDGNAVAGALADVFLPDMTVAMTTCAHCGADRVLAELLAYVRAPGVVLRCASCEGVLIRLVRSPQHAWLDLEGVRSIQLDIG